MQNFAASGFSVRQFGQFIIYQSSYNADRSSSAVVCPIRDRSIPGMAFGRFTVSQSHLRLYRREFEMGPIRSINSGFPQVTTPLLSREVWLDSCLSLSATTGSVITSHNFLAT